MLFIHFFLSTDWLSLLLPAPRQELPPSVAQRPYQRRWLVQVGPNLHPDRSWKQRPGSPLAEELEGPYLRPLLWPLTPSLAIIFLSGLLVPLTTTKKKVIKVINNKWKVILSERENLYQHLSPWARAVEAMEWLSRLSLLTESRGGHCGLNTRLVSGWWWRENKNCKNMSVRLASAGDLSVHIRVTCPFHVLL